MIDSDSIPISVPFDHYNKITEFETSASQGCHLCTLILDKIIGDHTSSAYQKRAKYGEKLVRPGPISLRFSESPHHKLHHLEPLAHLELEHCEESERGTRRLQFIEISLSDNVSLDIIPPATALGSTKSQATLDLVDRWLSACLKSHKQCSFPRPHNVPTRLLRISTSGMTGSVGDDLIVSLLQTEGTTPHGGAGLKYATVSYCWGGKIFFNLTSRTWDDLCKGVQVSRLSQTIQDAIWMASKLGLEYIWVDSLCIIQDSPEDWEGEASRMCSVYGDGFVTFAARGAPSAKEGLFTRRDPLRYSSCLMGRGPRGYEGKYIAADSAYRTRSFVHRWPLDKRAWVAQERLLAPRTINFGPFVSWICEEGCHSEFGVDKTGRLTREEHLKWKFSQIVLQPPLKEEKGHNDYSIVYSLWRDIVEDYTEARLSVRTDRLAALQGIIKAFEQYTGWRNNAGIWFQSPYLLPDLLWSPIYAPGDPPKSGLRPTWSWISMDCRVGLGRDLLYAPVSMVQTSLQGGGGGGMKAIQEAWLSLPFARQVTFSLR